MLAALLGPIVRCHGVIDNSLHWVIRDDECRVRTDHAPAIFTTIKHIAHRRRQGLDAPACKVAAGDDDFLAGLIKR
jgi:hypothetical protein